MTQSWIYWAIFAGLILILLTFLLTKSYYAKELYYLKAKNDEFRNKIAELETELKEKEQELTRIQQQLAEKSREIVQLESRKDKEIEVLRQKLQLQDENRQKEIKHWQERFEEQRKLFAENEKKLLQSFENLSHKILEETGKKFTEQNVKNVEQILAPFKEQLKSFKEKVEQTDKEHFGRHKEMLMQIKQLQELSHKMSEEAAGLVRALKGESKTQGIWGEMMLRRILEKSGLEKGLHYVEQPSFRKDDTERGRLQPDVLVYLPDNKVVIVDAKVSLTHYEQYINADDEKEKERLGALHLQSIRNHIKELAVKRYENIPELKGKNPDFVLMFIPVEPAFALALRLQPDLYETAFRQNIVMVTPSTLLAVLKMVDSMWTNERQRQNTQEIVRQASDLLDKFHGFVNDLITLGKKLDDSKGYYEQAMKKLYSGRGNLINRVLRLQKLGVPSKTKNPIPENLIKRAEENQLDDGENDNDE